MTTWTPQCDNKRNGWCRLLIASQ